jgi:hypothetical protein
LRYRKSSTKRGARTEKEEDDEILKETLDDFGSVPTEKSTRLTVQPSCKISYSAIPNSLSY